MNHTQGNSRQYPKVGQHGEQPAQSKSRTFGGGHAHVGANGVFGDAIENLGIDRIHAVIGERGKVIGHPQMVEIVLGIDFNGVVGLQECASDGAFQPPPEP